jgi:outer membrane protein W
MRHHPFLVAASAVFACALAATPARAGSWTLRLAAGLVSPSESLHTRGDQAEEVGVSVADGAAAAAALEYRFSPRVGVELGALYTSLDVRTTLTSAAAGSEHASDSLTVTPVWLGLDFHFPVAEKWDLYLGPAAAWVGYSDAAFDFPSQGAPVRFPIDDDYGYGAVAGVDVALGRWSFAAAVRYLATTAKTTGADLDLDPTILTVGVGIRF